MIKAAQGLPQIRCPVISDAVKVEEGEIAALQFGDMDFLGKPPVLSPLNAIVAVGVNSF